jgi:hypothetical protein
MEGNASQHVRLAGRLRARPSGFGIELGDCEVAIDVNAADRPWIGEVLGNAQTGADIEAIAAAEPTARRGAAHRLFAGLREAGALVDVAADAPMSGLDAVLMLEATIDRLCAATLERNPFWSACLTAQDRGDLDDRIVIGMVVENWHFLHREAYFDAPVLGYVPNLGIRLRMNEFFAEEYGHDEILLRSLNAVGISREDMYDAAPLPATLGLCNALAHWSHFDPMFFFLTMGILEGQGLRSDSFLDACERMRWPEAFVSPLRAHSQLNIKGEHGNLSRQLFARIPAIAVGEVRRLQAMLPTFVEIYDAFYRDVHGHYGAATQQLRRVSTW